MTAEPAQVWADLPDDTRAALLARSNRAGLMHLAGHLGLIVILATYVGLGLPLWGLVLLPLGILQVFLFTLQHECTHQTPFRSPSLNEVVGHLCGLILIQPFGWFRAFHMAHHRFTNDPARDPELQGDAKRETRRELVWHLGTLGYWAAKGQTLWHNARGQTEGYISPRAAPRIRREAWAMLAAYAAAALFTIFVSPILIWVWLIPLALGFPILRLYLLAEHGRCPQVANMFLNSRTTRTTRMVNWLAWNMPYHAEHHAYPQVPFHQLPQVHARVAPHLGAITDGYSTFTQDYVRSLNGTAGGASLP